MNKILLLIYISISLALAFYVSIGIYDIASLLFQDKILIGQNIASLFALASYIFFGFNMAKNRYGGIGFSLSLTALVLTLSLVEQSRIFVIEIIKQLGIPFIMTLIIFWAYKANIPDGLIVKEASLAAVLWLSLRLLTFENIYNILISVILFGIAYYLLEMIYPLSLKVNKNES